MPPQIGPATPEAVADHPLLARLAPEDRALIAQYLDIVHFQHGEAIIVEGADDRALYLMLDGHARMRRHGLDLGVVGPGDYFGELALLDPHPRAATVRAEEPVIAARMTPAGLDALAWAHPRLAFQLSRAFVTLVGDRLRTMTDEVGHLLRERSLPRRTHITVTFDGHGARTVPTGTTVQSLLPPMLDGHLVVAAHVDRRMVSLATPLSTDGTLQAVTTASLEGRATLRLSAGLLLLEALRHEGADGRMGQMAGIAQRVWVYGEVTHDLAARVQANLDVLVHADRALCEEWWTMDEAIAYFTQRGRHEVVELLGTRREGAVQMVTYGKTYALGLVPLVHRTGILGGCRVMPLDGGLLFAHAPQSAASNGGAPVDTDTTEAHARELAASQASIERLADEALRSHRRWQGALGVKSVGEFNRACVEGRVSELVRVVEGSQEKGIGRLADRIASRSGEVRIVTVAGPSSSGKTTFLKRLKVQLQVEGVQPVTIELDNYFRDREQTPRDASGEFDFEAFEGLNAPLLQQHLEGLFLGDTVRTARYDFRTGRSHPDGGATLRLEPHQVLMVEGIHGLNPRLLPGTLRERAFRLFIGPVAQLPFDDLSRVHGSDVRLIRRIVRDRHARGHDAMGTIRRWPSVRRGERQHIYPYLGQADAVFDTSLIYELAVLKVFAERYLLEVPRTVPEYATAHRLLRLLDQFVTIYPDAVPPNSLLREFIGGSGFEY